MNNDGFAELSAQSAKFKNDNLQLLQGLRVFKQKILDLVGGLGVSGNSETVVFEEILHLEGYTPPSTDLAKLTNHLDGVVFIYVMKQTAIVQAR